MRNLRIAAPHTYGTALTTARCQGGEGGARDRGGAESADATGTIRSATDPLVVAAGGPRRLGSTPTSWVSFGAASPCCRLATVGRVRTGGAEELGPVVVG